MTVGTLYTHQLDMSENVTWTYFISSEHIVDPFLCYLLYIVWVVDPRPTGYVEYRYFLTEDALGIYLRDFTCNGIYANKNL